MDQKEKWLRTMEVYDEYEKRFASVRADKPLVFPVTADSRAKIAQDVKKMLAYDEKLLPTVSNMKEVHRDSRDSYDILQLSFTTWENFYSAGTLFMPHCDKNTKVPLAFVFCGHGGQGRLTKNYPLMAERLARMGIAVMVPDNIGQGDRTHYGHWDVVAPFYCGLTLQGMIAMESVALIRHMVEQPFVDKTKVGACGNSGGGTLCLFLAALAPELTALCATGYPSEFSYVLSKERHHCACNLLLGCAHGPEMWEILSAFAPKPLMIEQGFNDGLIPSDLFLRTARKVGHTYRQMGAENNFRSAQTDTTHPWAEEDRRLIAQFFAENFGKDFAEEDTDDETLPSLLDSWHICLPEDGLSTEALSEKLTDKKMPEGTKLSDIFIPMFCDAPLCEDDIISDIGRGDVMRILAQMECALTKRGKF